MTANRKVVWAEGVMLGQQHFQQWDNYLQSQQQLFQYHAHPFHWGIAELIIDENFLAQGVIQVDRCVGLLRDRRWIDFDQTFDGALTLPVPENTSHNLSVFLALPQIEHVAGISGYPQTESVSAWQAVYQPMYDAYDTAREREVLLAKQNLRLVLDRESLLGSSAIKIAELEFNPQQLAYRVSPTYYPPLLNIGGSYHLSSWLAGFIGKLTQHVGILNGQKEKHRHVHNQFGYADFIYFNLIKTITTHLPKLMTLQSLPQLHPFHLYETCIVLLGELWGYLDNPLKEKPLPSYQHDNLGAMFASFTQVFDELLIKIIPVNSLDIVLHRISETQFQSVQLSELDLKLKQFCLAVYHENLTPVMIDKIHAQVKVSAPSQLTNIIQSFMQGIEFKYLATHGKDLMAKRNYHYFLLDKQSSGWRDILAEGKVAFFISHELAACQFELISY